MYLFSILYWIGFSKDVNFCIYWKCECLHNKNKDISLLQTTAFLMLLDSIYRQKTTEFLTCLLHASYNCAVIIYNILSEVLLWSFTID